MRGANEGTRTLRYWSQVEALTAPDAEGRDETGDDLVISYVRKDQFPWEQKLFPVAHKHFVRFGIVKRRSLEAELLEFLRTENTLPDDSGIYADQKEFTYLGVFQVDEAGLPQLGTMEVAAFASAFASLKNLRDLPFQNYQQTMSERFDAACESAAKDAEKVDVVFLEAMCDAAISELAWTPRDLENAPLAIVRTVPVKDAQGRNLNPVINPVNGFFFEDIWKIYKLHADGEPTGILSTYLAAPDEVKRIDCTTIDHLEAALTLERMPDGRWPSTYPMSLMQQVAVNEAYASLAKLGGIFSVNGPPGTGKTTLLMDCVAAIVVERAKILATFDDPSSAFEKRWEVQYQGVSRPTAIFALDERLHGHSIVIASSNNGAVENITRELPNVSKLDASYRDADYFKPLATILTNASTVIDSDEADDEPEPIAAWGLISAALGNKKNRNLFVNTLKATEKAAPDSQSTTRVPAAHNVFRLLDEAKLDKSWKQARDEFRAALADVKRIKTEISSIAALQSKVTKLNASADEAETETAQLQTSLADACELKIWLQHEVDQKRNISNRADTDLQNLKEGRSGWFARFFYTRAFRSWQGLWLESLTHQRNARSDLNLSEKALRDNQRGIIGLPERIASSESKAIKYRERARSAEAECQTAKGNGYLDFGELRKMSADERHQRLPLSNDALHEARALLFLRAMALHRAFATTASFLRNLKRSLEMIDGKPELLPILSEAAPHLWETLFLLVPVVSTTFASFARTFNHLEAGRIGWLFIDEAGQAVPQHAVGALYRGRRAVIVGDPLQVEPVITFNKAADAKLLELSTAPRRYQSTSTSTQVIADNVNPFGSYLKEDIWVGCPLKVHRRCVEPMFSISNEIAYENTMVLADKKLEIEKALTQGHPEKGLKARPLLGPSRWGARFQTA